ncbi:MAG: hypothetical protein KDC46_10535 [Thermoleophilia bacterium]|nr:hypothetical protein [Thermoleophilia bacterium]
MAVHTLLPGMKPYLAHRDALRGRPDLDGRAAPGRAAAVPAAEVSGGGGGPPEIGGQPDGPDLVLPSGVHVRRLRIGSLRVGNLQLQQALRGIQLLPVAHQRLIASLGIPIELVPVTQLERVTGTTDPVVGATRVVGPDGNAHPERIRVAAFQSQVNSSLTEAVQHEIGHAVSVVTSQDTSEDAAIAYAARY